MIILGIGGILGDAASAILKDGEIAAAIEESKLVRRRTHWGHHGELPEHSIATCLHLAGVKPEQVDAIAIVRPVAAGREGSFHLKLRARFPNARIVVVEHHAAHAASAYYPSPFTDATVLTLDRGGDFRCGTRWLASGTEMTLEQEHYYPDSIGDLYGRVTELLGFDRQCRRAQSAVALRRRRRSLPRPVPRDPGAGPGRAAHRPLVLFARSACRTAASDRASSNGWALRMPRPSRNPCGATWRRAFNRRRRRR